MNAAVARLGRVASVALLGAAVCGAALIIAAFLVPLYESASASTSGGVTSGTDTLVGVNGVGVVAVGGLPLVVTLAVGAALWHGSRRGAVAVAWTLTGLLAVLTLLAMLSIGVFVLPVTVALIIACATHRPLRTRAETAEGSPAPV